MAKLGRSECVDYGLKNKIKQTEYCSRSTFYNIQCTILYISACDNNHFMEIEMDIHAMWRAKYKTTGRHKYNNNNNNKENNFFFARL